MTATRDSGETRNQTGLSRRNLFRGGGLATAVAVASATRDGRAAATDARPAAAGKRRPGTDIYRSLGVRPLINGKGTYTILSGSQTLPEVKRAMDEASRHYVRIDELMDAVGERLAELTRAEWGIVTSGCAAALTHATAACLTGGDPEKLQRLPDLTGLPDQVVIPRHSINEYDQAVRALGVKVVTVDTARALEAALGPRTAMVMVLAGEAADSGPLSTEAIVRAARPKNIPVLVDAAAEFLTMPPVHLQRGANLVGYSGGKCLRGPQCAGLLLGDKDLVQAAWLASAPHHGFGRSMKVGKEEIVGMLTAVEMWTRRDHAREWRTWEAWLAHIAARVVKVSGVTTEIIQPAGLINKAPQLRIRWDARRLGVTGEEVQKRLAAGEPRIALADAGGGDPDSGTWISIVPYMMVPGDERVIAEELWKALGRPPARPTIAAGDPGRVVGRWNVHIAFARDRADHRLDLTRNGDRLAGTYRTAGRTGDVRGGMEGDTISLRTRLDGGDRQVEYDFSGTVAGDGIEGVVRLGEYGKGRWKAVRQ